MPYGRPPFVAPRNRANWDSLSHPRRMFALKEYQCYTIRVKFEPQRYHIDDFDTYLPDIPHVIAAQLGIDRDYISTKTRRLLAKYFPDAADGPDVADEPRPGTSRETRPQSPLSISGQSSTSTATTQPPSTDSSTDDDSDSDVVPSSQPDNSTEQLRGFSTPSLRGSGRTRKYFDLPESGGGATERRDLPSRQRGLRDSVHADEPGAGDEDVVQGIQLNDLIDEAVRSDPLRVHLCTRPYHLILGNSPLEQEEEEDG